VSDPISSPTTPNRFVEFLTSLTSEGKVAVGSGQPPAIDEAALEFLCHCEEVARAELVGEAPPLSLEVAAWASSVLYQACQFVVCRDMGEPAIVAALKSPCPEARTPSADWSTDLVFRYLPDVYRLAQHLSRNDPLVREIRFLAVSWPLSSVGIPEVSGLDLDPFWEHPGLRQLYLDRILRTSDLGRLGDPRVDAGVRTALGAHPELAPEFATRLAGTQS
jgi:hypothetical protein